MSGHADGHDGIGFLQFWGNSFGFDILGQTKNECVSGAGDPRHLLFSWANNSVSPCKHSFFIHEKHPEIIARFVILLDIVVDKSLSPRERVELFFEVYGNALVRERTAVHVSSRVDDLQDLIYEKEKDAISDVMKGWRLKSGPFDIEALRDTRNRHAYGNRFDARVNLFDYDYTNNLASVGATIIHWREFKLFRLIGLAFEPRTAAYKTPNRTLGGYLRGQDNRTGRPMMVRGFWGDVMNGPFYGFGVDTDNVNGDRDRLFKLFSEQHRHYSAEVGEFNLTKILVAMYLGETFGLKPQQAAEDAYPFKSPLDYLEGFEHRESERDEEKKKQQEDQGDTAAPSDSKVEEETIEPAVDLEAATSGSLNRLAEVDPSKTLLPGLKGLSKISFLLGDFARAVERAQLRSSVHDSSGKLSIHGFYTGSLASSATLIGPAGLLVTPDGRKGETQDFNGDYDDTRSPFGCLEKSQDEEPVVFVGTPANPSQPGEPKGDFLRSQVRSGTFVDRLFGVEGLLAPNARLFVESFKYQSHFPSAAKLKFRSRVHQAANRLGFVLEKGCPDVIIPAGGPIEEARHTLQLNSWEKDSPDVMAFKREL